MESRKGLAEATEPDTALMLFRCCAAFLGISQLLSVTLNKQMSKRLTLAGCDIIRECFEVSDDVNISACFMGYLVWSVKKWANICPNLSIFS